MTLETSFSVVWGVAPNCERQPNLTTRNGLELASTSSLNDLLQGPTPLQYMINMNEAFHEDIVETQCSLEGHHLDYISLECPMTSRLHEKKWFVILSSSNTMCGVEQNV